MAALNFRYYRVKLELLAPLLGTVPKQRAVFTKFIASKAQEAADKARKAAKKAGKDPDTTPAMANAEPATPEALAEIAKETEGIPEDPDDREKTGWTIFMEDAKGRYLLSYMIRGQMSAAAQVLKTYGKGPSQMKQLNDKVKKYIFVHEKRIYINEVETPADEQDYGHPLIHAGPNGPVCERPLRASTPMGPRVTVTRSDAVLAGATLEFHLKVLDVEGAKIPKGCIESLLQYGECSGLGQWRSSGDLGSFKIVDLVEIEEDKLPPLESSSPAKKAAPQATSAK